MSEISKDYYTFLRDSGAPRFYTTDVKILRWQMRNKLKNIPEPNKICQTASEYLTFFNVLGLNGHETKRFVNKLMDSFDLAQLQSAQDWAMKLIKNLHTQNLQRQLGHLFYEYLFRSKQVDFDYELIPHYVREFFLLLECNELLHHATI